MLKNNTLRVLTDCELVNIEGGLSGFGEWLTDVLSTAYVKCEKAYAKFQHWRYVNIPGPNAV